MRIFIPLVYLLLLASKPLAAVEISVLNPGFIENKGQLTDEKGAVVPDVYYYHPGSSMDVFLTKQGLSFQFKRISFQPGDTSKHNTEYYRLDLLLSGANIQSENI